MRKSALYGLGLVVAALVALGLVVLSSASGANSARYHGGDAYFFMKRQFAYIVAGVVLAACVAKFDYRHWRDQPLLTWAFFGVVLVLLVAVFAFPPVKGSRRWLPLGPINLQPSELAKLLTVVVVGMWMDKEGWRVELLSRGVVWPCALIGAIALPVMLEPDFGSTMVIGLAGFLVLFVAGAKLLHLAPFFFLGVAGVVWKVVHNANRMARIAAFLGIKLNVGAQVADKAADNAAYQANQAMVALQNGGLWGVGLNQSLQKHYYLPEAHTDMIFPIGAEELGLLFSVATVVLFAAFFALSVHIARHASDRFGRFLVIGMAFIIFFQAMFNIGVVCSALPMKGMALPFFSYGGTNMLSAFFAVGTILSVGIHSIDDRRRKVRARVIVGRR